MKLICRYLHYKDQVTACGKKHTAVNDYIQYCLIRIMIMSFWCVICYRFCTVWSVYIENFDEI